MIGERIRAARESAGLSQAALAAQAGTTQQTVDRIERGDTRFSRAIVPITQVLGLSGDPDGSGSHSPDTERSVLADRLRERLDATGLNQLSAARAAGVGDDLVRDLLRGRIAEPSAKRLLSVARVLGCSIEWLLGEPDAAVPPAPVVLNARCDDGALRHAAVILRAYGREAIADELDELAQIIARAQERAKA